MDRLTLLKNGIETWNKWRSLHPNEPCNLAGQDLSYGYFFGGNFCQVDLSGANLRQACLISADFRGADLTGADLTGAYLADAVFYGADLSHANLGGANLDRADLRRANLLGVQLARADIRLAYLPNPNIDPLADEVVHLLAQRNLSAQSAPTPEQQTFIEAVHRRLQVWLNWRDQEATDEGDVKQGEQPVDLPASSTDSPVPIPDMSPAMRVQKNNDGEDETDAMLYSSANGGLYQMNTTGSAWMNAAANGYYLSRGLRQ
ncbi:MAG: pentapeptide repeat-containing protein [Phormidesmis sp.]